MQEGFNYFSQEETHHKDFASFKLSFPYKFTQVTKLKSHGDVSVTLL